MMNVENSNSLDTSALLRMIEQYQQKTGAQSMDTSSPLPAEAASPSLEPAFQVRESAPPPALGRYINVFA